MTKRVAGALLATFLFWGVVSGCKSSKGPDAASSGVAETTSLDSTGEGTIEVAADLPGDIADNAPEVDDATPLNIDDLAKEADGGGLELVEEVFCSASTIAAYFFDEGAPDGLSTEVLVPPYPDQPELNSFSWQISVLRAHSMPSSLHFGGEDGLGYDNGHRVAAGATLSGVELPEEVKLELELWLYLDVEEAPYSDYFTIAVDVEGMRVPIWTRSGSDQQREWFPLQLDLTHFSGRVVDIVFIFDSRDELENSGEGVYLDDLVVTGSCETVDPCESDVQCASGNPCVLGDCVNGACLWEFLDICCLSLADCEDWDNCTIEQCVDGSCFWQHDPEPLCCNSNDDCADSDPDCTIDFCENGSCASLPSGADICCQVDAECDDGDACTADLCEAYSCAHENLCCSVDADCNDLDDQCTVDSCIAGVCSFVPTAIEGCCFSQLLTFGFESGQLAGWEVESDQSESAWQLVDTQAAAGDWSLHYGNPLAGSYSSDSQGRATSPPIALPTGAAASVGAHLYYDTEECCDKLEVALVDQSGERHVLGQFSGESSGWDSWEADLTKFVGQTIHLEFFILTDSIIEGLGVFVDEMSVSIVCCDEATDCDDDNPCTVDSCPGPESLCEYVPVPDCCQSNGACDDEDSCTQDSCVELLCEHVNLCCESDLECDDADDLCTIDVCLDSYCSHLSTGASGCCEEILFSDSFEEAELDGYQVENLSPVFLWHVSDVEAYSGSLSLTFSDEDGITYGPDAEGTVITPPVEIPLVDASPTLEFMAKYNTESCCDWWKVHLIVEGEWSELGSFGGEEDWKQFVFPLDEYLGKTVQVAFEFFSDGAISYDGVFIDDLYVGQHCCSVPADCDDGDPCTQDICPGEKAHCEYIPVANCCASHEDCEDDDDCTHDICDENQCLNFAECCTEHSDCDDGEDLCTVDSCADGFCKYKPQYLPTCCFPSVFLEDFDEPLGEQWVVENSSPEFGWRLHDSKSVTGDFSIYYGNLDGSSYGTSNSGEFITPPIAVPVAPSVAMAYQLWSDVEAGFDLLLVSVLWNDEEIHLETISGSSIENWQLKEVDLTQYVGQEVRLRFYFDCDFSTSYEGLWIDQLRVDVTCCYGDEECLSGSPCVMVTCAGDGGMCVPEDVADCCVNESDCDDADPCTLDLCVDGQCDYSPLC